MRFFNQCKHTDFLISVNIPSYCVSKNLAELQDSTEKNSSTHCYSVSVSILILFFFFFLSGLVNYQFSVFVQSPHSHKYNCIKCTKSIKFSIMCKIYFVMMSHISLNIFIIIVKSNRN